MSIIAELLGTARYLCRGGREKRWGVKAISDWLEGGGAKLFYKKNLGGVSSLIARYTFQISKYSFFSLFQSHI